MAITVTAASLNGGGGGAAATMNSSTATYAFDVGSGSNRGLIVAVHWFSNPTRTVSGVTFNGTAMSAVANTYSEGDTKHVSPSGDKLGTQLWSLINPDSGSHNIVVTMSSTALEIDVGAMACDGANQTTLTENGAPNSGNSGTAPSQVVTSASGDLAFASLTGVTLSSYTCNDTARYGGVSSNGVAANGGTIAGGASVTIDWTDATLATFKWYTAGCNIKAAGGAANAVGSYFYRLVGGMDGAT